MTKNRLFWIVALVSLVLDQISKYWVIQNFDLRETWLLLPGVFNLTYIRNPGVAFGWFSHLRSLWPWLSLGVSLGLMARAWFGSSLSLWSQLGCGFILGGAVGNGIDRFRWNEVVDFLDFSPLGFPFIFNVADVSVNVGIVCLLIAVLREPQPNGSSRPQ